MRLHEFIRSPAITCATTTSLSEAARMMHVHEVGSLVVLDDAGEIAGMVTDRDLAVKGYARDRESSTPVGEIMTPHPLTIGVDADTNEAATTMMHHGVRRLPVVDAEGMLCGIVALDDLVVFVEHESETVRRALDAQIRKDSGGWARGWD